VSVDSSTVPEAAGRSKTEDATNALLLGAVVLSALLSYLQYSLKTSIPCSNWFSESFCDEQHHETCLGCLM